jgi:acyl carrier protein
VERAELETWVRTELADVLDLPLDEVQPSSDLADDLDADSFDLIELINHVERTYKVHIDEHEFHELETVGEMVDLVERAVGRAG